MNYLQIYILVGFILSLAFIQLPTMKFMKKILMMSSFWIIVLFIGVYQLFTKPVKES